MDILTLLIVTALAIGLVWLVTRGGLAEPLRSIVIGVLAVAILLAILRLLGLL